MNFLGNNKPETSLNLFVFLFSFNTDSSVDSLEGKKEEGRTASYEGLSC
jgi:hypothetical protein